MLASTDRTDSAPDLRLSHLVSGPRLSRHSPRLSSPPLRRCCPRSQGRIYLSFASLRTLEEGQWVSLPEEQQEEREAAQPAAQVAPLLELLRVAAAAAATERQCATQSRLLLLPTSDRLSAGVVDVLERELRQEVASREGTAVGSDRVRFSSRRLAWRGSIGGKGGGRLSSEPLETSAGPRSFFALSPARR